MWDHPNDSRPTGGQTGQQMLSHDRPCQQCGHALHTFLPCSDACGCRPQLLPGAIGALSPAV